MKLHKVTIHNFLTIGHATLELDDRGLLLIQGENNDDTSAISNGAGKSSLTDAICWGNYGETARGVAGDAVVNKIAKKDCSVEQIWIDGDMEYRIVRYRKHKTGKNMLTASQRDLMTGIGTDLSKGTDKETQEVVNRILGCSLEVFKGAIYAGQEAMPDLPGMTDKQLKLLVEEAAGTAELADAYTEASKRALVAEKEHLTAVTHLKSLTQRQEGIEAEIAEVQIKFDEFENGRKDRARAELARVKPIGDDITDKTARADVYDVATLTTRKSVIEIELASHKTQEAELARLVQVEREIGDKVTRFRTTVGHLKGSTEHQAKKVDEVDSQVGTPCGECGKPYCEHDLATVKEMRANALTLAKKALLEAATGYKRALAEQGDARTVIDSYKSGMTDVSAVSAELVRISQHLAEEAQLRRQINELGRAIEAVKTAAKGKMIESNPWQRVLEDKKGQLERLVKEIAATQQSCAELEDRAELTADAAKVFGPAGVRAHILDTVTPFLNEKTSEHIGILADGNISATWSTLSKTAKGDLKEKFNIEVVNDKGAESFAGLSGGEKRKVRLAAGMALQDMVASRAEKPLGLWIGDEIDHALDDAGLERLMAVLEKKAKERGTVLVISHNALSDWIDSVITVTKSGGVSTVTGATERGF